MGLMGGKPAPTPEPEEEPVRLPTVTETKLHDWRYQSLARLGFSGAILDVLADHADVHLAEKLIRRGCPLDVAARILV